MDTVTAGAVIIGIINGVKLIQLPDKTSFAYFLIAIILGIVLGYFHMWGLDIQNGIIIALASSGVYKLTQVAGGK